MSQPSKSVEGEVLARDGLVVSLEHIGEGRDGDFDPADPADVRMLRLDVFPDRDDNEAHDGASYVTSFGESVPAGVRQAFLEHVMVTVSKALAADPDAPVRHLVGHLAGLGPADHVGGTFVGRDEILDTHGDLGVGRVVDDYENRADDPAGVRTYVCAFGEGDDVTHADRIEGEFTRDREAIAAARLGTTSSPSP